MDSNLSILSHYIVCNVVEAKKSEINKRFAYIIDSFAVRRSVHL